MSLFFRNFSLRRHSSHIYRTFNQRSFGEAVYGSSVSLGSKPLLPHGTAHSEFFSRRDALEKEG
jgi:hypothetical protein